MSRIGSGRELFVYWRLARVDLPAALEAVQAWQKRLTAEVPQLKVRLLVRADAAQAEATLMETYAVHGDGVDPSLQARIEREGLEAFARWQRGARHVEVFSPCLL